MSVYPSSGEVKASRNSFLTRWSVAKWLLILAGLELVALLLVSS